MQRFAVAVGLSIGLLLGAEQAQAQYRYTDDKGISKVTQFKMEVPAPYRNSAVWVGSGVPVAAPSPPAPPVVVPAPSPSGPVVAGPWYTMPPGPERDAARQAAVQNAANLRQKAEGAEGAQEEACWRSPACAQALREALERQAARDECQRLPSCVQGYNAAAGADLRRLGR
jgi:hypothetical protein